MKKFILILIFIFFIPLMSFSGELESVQFLTEQYPPYNFMDKNNLKGISVDILLKAMQNSGENFDVSKLTLLPWARGYNLALNKQNVCLFSTTRTSQRENLFKWAGPISATTIGLIGKKSKHMKINSVSDLEKYKIGAVLNDIGEQLLKETHKKIKIDSVGGVNAIEKSIKKLNIGRLDLWAYETNVAKWSIKNMGLSPDDYEVVYVLKKAELYYAFNKNTPDSKVKALQKAIDDMKKSGEDKNIIKLYLK